MATFRQLDQSGSSDTGRILTPNVCQSNFNKIDFREMASPSVLTLTGRRYQQEKFHN
jgi:hypothetical protein